MRGRDEWLVIGFKAQRKKEEAKKETKQNKIGLESKWGKEWVRDLNDVIGL